VDHRAVDGYRAFLFLRDLVQTLTEPASTCWGLG